MGTTTPTRHLTVGQLAKRSGITVRTEAGYRLYDTDDVARLQQILFHRELGFALDDVAALLDDPSADPVAHLTRQRRLLGERSPASSRCGPPSSCTWRHDRWAST